MKKKICIFTGTRAEYGLLKLLILEMMQDSFFEVITIVSGTHLSPEFGCTVKEIEADGVTVDKKIEMIVSADTPSGISKSIGLGIIGYADALADVKPDIVLLLGDRFETFAMAIASMVARIPIVHLHGGESTEGLIDESIRHSITKMAHLHFTSTEKYRQRVIQLGEDPATVFAVGALAFESIKKLKLMEREEFEKSIKFNLNDKNILVTFHPVTLEKHTAEKQFASILSVINSLENTSIIFTKTNADTNGRIINKMIDEFVNVHSDKSVAFSSLGQLRYFSALKFVDAVVGNSSSGIIEAPSFKIGTINVGDRQRGRLKAKSVIDCAPDNQGLTKAFKRLYSTSFRNSLKTVENPYESRGTTEKIIEIIKKTDFTNIKKRFFDIVFRQW